MRTSNLFLTVLATLAAGHGGMLFPPSRNVLFSHYCPHCANGHGVCGDGTNSQWTTSLVPSETYGSYFRLERPVIYAGGILEVALWFTVAHKGLFSIELCEHPGAVITEDCFKRLDRDPTDTAVSPYVAAVPGVFFLLEDSCMTKATEANPLVARFKIPEGTETSHAIIRYRWSTGNSCSPSPHTTPGTADSTMTNWKVDFNGATGCGLAMSSLSLCGNDCPNASCGGEWFTNCADVAVWPGDSLVSRFHYTTTSDPVDKLVTTTTLGPGQSTTPTTTTTTTTTTTSSTTTQSGVTQATTTTRPGSDCVPGGPVQGSLDVCRAEIVSFGLFDDFCRDNCNIVAGGDATANAWCRAMSICDLTTCVATFWSNVCRVV